MKELDALVPTEVCGILRLANGNIFYLKIEPQDDVVKLYMRSQTNATRAMLTAATKID